MEAAYKRVPIILALLAMITLTGFYKKYFSLAPDFKSVRGIYHFHAISLCIYLVLLIIQPTLIIHKRLSLHRALGMFSYFLVPAIGISMILVYHSQYLTIVASGKPEREALAFVFSPSTDLIPFLIFFSLAVLNKKDTAKHMRYIISTGIIVVGPGLGRVLMNWAGMDILAAIGLITIITLIAFISLIIYDRRMKVRFTVNPFTVACIIWLVPNILITFFPYTAIFQSFAKWLVTTI
jgi:hypothetical protein